MKRIIQLSGVSLPSNVNMPKVTRTPEGEAMGHVPGWAMLLDPDYINGGAPRNRARANEVFEVGTGSLVVGAFANGAAA